MRLRAVAVVLAVAGWVGTGAWAQQGRPAQAGAPASQAAPAQGATRLEGATFVCSGEAAAAAGFRLDAATGQAVPRQGSAPEGPKPRSTAWIVRLLDGEADLLPVAGPTPADGPTGRFSLEKTPAALALWQRDGLALHAITIDLDHASFVYSGQRVGGGANEVTVFTGSCRPYV